MLVCSRYRCALACTTQESPVSSVDGTASSWFTIANPSEISFHSQYVLSHHANFRGHSKKQKGDTSSMPYSPRELCVTVSLQYGNCSLKQSKNSRSYKAKNCCFCLFVCFHFPKLRLPAEESSHKNFRYSCHSVLFYLVTAGFLRRTVKRL